MVDLKHAISENETVYWEGKPNKKCFILESIFNPLLPFAIIWAIVDIFVFSASAGEDGGLIIGGFLLLHMMPVWLYIGGVILSFRRYHNTQFIVTDQGVYISGGAFAYSYNMKPWAELSNISIKRGIIDQFLKVGDIVFSCGEVYYDSDGDRHIKNFAITDIPDYEEVFKLVKRLQKDIHADTMYPNDLRPNENHGYNTNYKN